MSDIKLISPLLDQFDMGDPISTHNGVCCCPAMKKGTTDKYIVKIIHIPASQTQLDALLLTGAYPDEQSARSYFKELAEDVEKEVNILRDLSALEGFLPYEGWQTVAMDDAVGYKVYLLGTYKRTLEKQFIREPLTHLNAVNLGLDLCASLAICRRAGYLYVDLKPGNIYVTADKEFRIGDLGFVRLDSLLYASLPDKYRSAYTAPELADAFSSLNTTVDIYAVGLILYQVFNNGVLPELTDSGTFPPPEYADYEMSEIILKACAKDPSDRWQDPVEMGQALVSYMQRNGVNDTPIVPVSSVMVDEIISTVASITETGLTDGSESEAESVAEDESTTAALDSTSDTSAEVLPVLNVSEDEQNDLDNLLNSITNIDTEDLTSDDADDLTDASDESDETDPGNSDVAVTYDEVSDDLSEILAQVDELTAHDVPDPVVAPEPVEITVPKIEITDKEDESEVPIVEDVTLPENFEPLDNESNVFIPEEEPETDTDSEISEPVVVKKKSKGWLIGIILALLLLGIVAAGFLYYQYFYLLPINSIKLEGTEDSLTVLVDAAGDSQLKVVCSDSHGNQITLPVSDGKVTFENLVPNTAYNIKVVADGFHRLTGNTATAYSTPAQTNIVQFNAVTGSEDGSAILGFTVEGPDDGQWSVVYSAPGEAEQTVVFPSHMVTLTGLTVGKEYTLKLVSDSDLYVTGADEITFTASRLIYAEELVITSFVNGKLSVSWAAPKDVFVEHWTVRCYNDSEYNETMITSDTSAVFEGLDHNQNYTIEVTAAGMSVSQRTFVAKNALTASNFKTDNSDPNKLVITWDVGSAENSDGWLMLYKIDGSEKQASVPCSGNGAVINGVVPGAVYEFSLQDATGAPVLCEPFSYTMPEAKTFSAYNVTAEDMSFRLYKAPDIEYKTTFKPSDSIYMKINLGKRPATSDDKISILFATRDENGNVINSSSTTLPWNSLWTYRECILAIPYTPEEAGNYHICIYFNGQYITDQLFTIENAAD